MTAEIYPITPIGYVTSSRTEIADDHWGKVQAHITVNPAVVGENALQGLTDFSHVDIVFIFHKVAPDDAVKELRHPRGNTSWPKIGMLAQRAKNRVNRIGITTARIISVSENTLIVEGLDAIDGTPIVDIKPCMRDFLPREIVQEPIWATELMQEYFLD